MQHEGCIPAGGGGDGRQLSRRRSVEAAQHLGSAARAGIAKRVPKRVPLFQLVPAQAGTAWAGGGEANSGEWECTHGAACNRAAHTAAPRPGPRTRATPTCASRRGREPPPSPAAGGAAPRAPRPRRGRRGRMACTAAGAAAAALQGVGGRGGEVGLVAARRPRARAPGRCRLRPPAPHSAPHPAPAPPSGPPAPELTLPSK